MDKLQASLDASASEFEKVMGAIRMCLIDGIRDGFFDNAISVEASRSDRRKVVITTGKSYKFTIRLDDLPH